MDEKELFSLFIKECGFWVKIFNLEDVDIIYLLTDDLDEDEIAATQYRYDSHQAIIMLSSEVDDVDTIERAALHEILELLLMPVKIQAINMGDAYHPYVQHETHAVIYRIEKLFKEKKDE